MRKISKKKQLFVICFAAVWALLNLACGLETGKNKAKDKPVVTTSKPRDIKKPAPKPAIKSKIPQKTKKPAPVFLPQASVTMADGKVYEVADFAFYSHHRDFEGGMYYPKSGSQKWFLYLKQGPIWKTFDFAKVKLITLSKSKSYNWLKINLVNLDGSKLQGLHPLYSYTNNWHKHGHVYLLGNAKVLGRTGNFKCKIEEVFKFERVEEDMENTPPKFKITHNRKEQHQTTITDPEFKLIWERVRPTYLDVYTLKKEMPVTVNNTKIKIKPQEIESVTIPQRRTSLFTVKMKKGETIKIKLPPRIFGKLKNGDILFTYMFEQGRRVVKNIQIK